MYVQNGSGDVVTTTPQGTKMSKRKKRTSFRIFVVVLLLLAVALTSLLLPLFNIKTIEVIGNQKVDVQTIMNACGIIKGTNIFRISLTDVRQNIQQIAYIDIAKVKRILPDKLLIDVTERKPVGYIAFMGSYIYIDKTGYVLEVVPNAIEQSIPQISGLKFNQFKIGDKITVDDEKKLEIVVSCVKEILTYNLLKHVSEIDVHDIDNIQLNIDNRIMVNVGDIFNIQYKISFLKAILNQLNEDEQGYIDLSIEKPTFTPLN